MASPFKPWEEPAFVTSTVTCQYENVIYVKYALQSQEREQESGPPEKSEPRRMRVWHSLMTSPLPSGGHLGSVETRGPRSGYSETQRETKRMRHKSVCV